MPKGYPARGVYVNRLNAVDACIARKWDRGTMLRSCEWAADQKVIEVGLSFVRIRRDGGSSERVRSFPPDVIAVEGP